MHRDSPLIHTDTSDDLLVTSSHFQRKSVHTSSSGTDPSGFSSNTVITPSIEGVSVTIINHGTINITGQVSINVSSNPSSHTKDMSSINWLSQKPKQSEPSDSMSDIRSPFSSSSRLRGKDHRFAERCGVIDAEFQVLRRWVGRPQCRLVFDSELDGFDAYLALDLPASAFSFVVVTRENYVFGLQCETDPVASTLQCSSLFTLKNPFLNPPASVPATGTPPIVSVTAQRGVWRLSLADSLVLSSKPKDSIIHVGLGELFDFPPEFSASVFVGNLAQQFSVSRVVLLEWCD